MEQRRKAENRTADARSRTDLPEKTQHNQRALKRYYTVDHAWLIISSVLRTHKQTCRRVSSSAACRSTLYVT